MRSMHPRVVRDPIVHWIKLAHLDSRDICMVDRSDC
jgi:hypothetical protein